MTACPYRFAQGWHCCMLAGHAGSHAPAAADYLTPPASPAAVAQAGYAFVFLYYKMATFAAHAAEHRAVGLGVVPTFETTATRALSGAAGGAVDGAACAFQSKAAGQTTGTAVAVNISDFKPTAAQMPPLYAYLQAFDAALGNFVPVPYVTMFALDQLVNLGASPSLGWWQNPMSDGGENTTGGNVDPNAAFLQRVTPVLSIPGAAPGSWDEDAILRLVPVWGLTTVTPVPPPPAPAPSPVPTSSAKGNDMIIVRTSTNGAAYLVSGGKRAPIYDETTVKAFGAIGVPTVNLPPKDFNGIVAAYG